MYKCVDSRLGRFDLVRELGRGLNSTVYLAFDPEIERQVVLKLLSTGSAGAEKIADRVKRVGGLSHVGIAKLYDLEYTDTGAAYVVTEWVEGESLEAVLARGSLSQEVALRLTLEVLDALAYAHAQGVCHRNLKPSNIILTSDQHLKITDFWGTKSGSVSAFMAPEQLKEEGDERSDLFSVGVILYLMLSGYRPFQGNSDATIEFKLVHQHPVPVAAMNMELSPEVDVVVGRLLAKNPADRYQNGEEAKRAVLEIVEKEVPTHIAAELLHPTTVVLAADLMRRGPGPDEAEESSHRGTWWKAGIAASVALTLAVGAVEIGRRLRTVDAPTVANRLTVPTEALRRRPSEPVRVKTTLKTGTAEGNRIQPTVKIVAVPIELRQPFKVCRMTIWADKRVVYKNTIRAEKKSRFMHMGSSNAEYLTMVQMPEGSHSVKVEIKADQKYEQSGTVSATFSQNESSKLVITSEKSGQPLQIVLN
ncbi:MAG TPA: serine/threonine-protein kinase [Terriglobales bacterium]